MAAEADLVVVGSGPAGLAAAIAAREAGVARVTVLEREAAAGGIPRHCGHPPYGLREFGRLMTGPAYARRIVERARSAGVSIKTGVSVVALHEGPGLRVSSDRGVGTVSARRILVATGVRETTRAARLIGGTKPYGVMNTGTLQGLVYLKNKRPFERPAILGTELVAFSAILTLRHAGISPVAMIEKETRATARWPCALFPRLLRIPLWLGTTVEAIEGEERMTGLVVRGPDGAERRIAADGLVVSGGFRPEATLLRASHVALDDATGGPIVDQFGRTSDPAVFAAGNLLRGVETAGWSFREGRAAGKAIARSLAGTLPPPTPALHLECASPALSFALPQRIVPQEERHGHIQLRAARPVKGRLALKIGGTSVTEIPLNTMPERRVLLPLAAVPADATGHGTLVVEEAAQ